MSQETADPSPDASTNCDWCGKTVTPENTVKPDTATQYAFCVDCPAEEAWLLDDRITQKGIEQVIEHLSSENAAQYRELPPTLQISFFYKCVQKGIIKMNLTDQHETVSDTVRAA